MGPKVTDFVDVHASPTTASPITGALDGLQHVPVYCQVHGDTVTTAWGKSDHVWFRTDGGYVPGVYVVPGGTVPSCT